MITLMTMKSVTVLIPYYVRDISDIHESVCVIRVHDSTGMAMSVLCLMAVTAFATVISVTALMLGSP
jgi:type IV secretory pathway component VirB8